MAFLSDGTLKWLTLVTAVLTSDNIFCIEEPENYLHPWMQAEMCMLMREHLEAKKESAFILMTTHSETLLNAARPEEVIVVDMKHGARASATPAAGRPNSLAVTRASATT